MSEKADPDELSTFLHPRYDPTPLSTATYTLVVTAGPDVGKRVSLDAAHAGPLLVGTSVSCELVLTDRVVSRRHLALEPTPTGLRVRDLGSKNGTFVNDVRVREATLEGRECIRIGETLIAIETSSRGVPSALPEETAFGRMLGASREMRRLYPVCTKLALANVPVILEGETGTGKEVLAECLHEAGPRANGPFVVFDCTMVSPALLESELFGHERGAFTGATSARQGVFEQAHGGTLFLDEIGDLDVALQPKLLRALESAQVRRVGGSAWITVDVRVIAATRRNLDEAVEEGRFRDDLFHRLAVARLELPPLRSRRGDIPILVEAFSRQMGASPRAVPPEVLARWEREPWPGNVRELRNAVARFLALGETEGVESPFGSPATALADQWVALVLAQGASFSAARQRLMSTFERRYVEQMLAAHDGNVSRAAAASGIARRYFQILRARREKTR
jgi:DNA-binding NtrC family response regulator